MGWTLPTCLQAASLHIHELHSILTQSESERNQWKQRSDIDVSVVNNRSTSSVWLCNNKLVCSFCSTNLLLNCTAWFRPLWGILLEQRGPTYECGRRYNYISYYWPVTMWCPAENPWDFIWPCSQSHATTEWDHTIVKKGRRLVSWYRPVHRETDLNADVSGKSEEMSENIKWATSGCMSVILETECRIRSCFYFQPFSTVEDKRFPTCPARVCSR